jgi:small Trp-rich protein
MWLLWIAVAMLGLWYFDVGPFGQLSGWWIGGLFLLAFLWFEFGERLLGFDKKRINDEYEQARQNRIKLSPKNAKGPVSRR